MNQVTLNSFVKTWKMIWKWMQIFYSQPASSNSQKLKACMVACDGRTVVSRPSSCLIEYCLIVIVLFFITPRSCFDNALYFGITLTPNSVIVL